MKKAITRPLAASIIGKPIARHASSGSAAIAPRTFGATTAIFDMRASEKKGFVPGREPANL